MSHMPALDNPERIDVTALEARVDDLEEGGVGGAITGSGTTEYLAKFTDADTIGAADAFYYTPFNNQFVMSKRLLVGVNLNEATTSGGDPALTVITLGTDLIQHDGGVQSFNNADYDLDATPSHTNICQGFLSQASPSYTGTGELIVSAFVGGAVGGTINYVFQGLQGTFRVNEDAVIGESLTVGSGSAASEGQTVLHTDLLIDNVRTVSLGNNVQNFVVPGTALADATIGFGYSGGVQGQFALRNTASNTAGMEIRADTTVNANAHASIAFFRGAGGAGDIAGLSVVGSAGAFATGAAVNDVCLWSYDPASAGRRISFATGSTPTVRAHISTAGLFTVLNGFAQTGSLGFYGTTPIAKQTGVAVTAGGIHAALVALGLIGA